MSKKIETRKFRLKLLEIAWLSALATVAILGLSFVVIGTGASTVDRYLVPPQILPGLGVLYFCAVLTAIGTAKSDNSTFVLTRLKETIAKKIGGAEREKLRNMALLLTFLMVAFAMIQGTTPMYRGLATNYLASLFINVLSSIVAAVGIFGWLASLFISKQSRRKP